MVQITDGKGLDVSRVAKARRAFLVRNMASSRADTLEIGALDNPTFMKTEGGVFFADFFSQRESQDRHRNSAGHPVEKIVPVDYLLRGRALPEAVGMRPDLIMAHHVIEHIPNPIKWLQEVRAICDAGANLFLSIPDRRFTFDFFKPLTDAVDWIRAYDEDAARPTKYQILRHLFYHAEVNRAAVWAGDVPDDHLHRISMPAAIAKADQLSANYADVHCWVFTSGSFKTILEDLKETGMLSWQLQAEEPVATGDNEFRVLLRAI